MRVAITGATGFIGSYMVHGMAKAGHDVRVLCRPGREDAVAHPPEKECEVHVGDLLDGQSLRGFLDDVQLLLHLASAHDHFTDEQMREVNIGGTERLIEEAKRVNPKLDFWVISSAVIGTPVYSYYRDSKRIQEKIIRGSGIPWASFRPTLVYGIGDYRHTAPLLRQCSKKSGKIWVPHDGISRINPVHVEDVVDAVLRYFDFERGIDCVYELAGPAGMSYNEFLDATIAATGGGATRKNISKKWADRLIFLKGLVKDVTEERRASSYFMLNHEHDITNAVHELDWQPRTYQQGLKDVLASDWWTEEGEKRNAGRVSAAVT